MKDFITNICNAYSKHLTEMQQVILIPFVGLALTLVTTLVLLGFSATFTYLTWIVGSIVILVINLFIGRTFIRAMFKYVDVSIPSTLTDGK